MGDSASCQVFVRFRFWCCFVGLVVCATSWAQASATPCNALQATFRQMTASDTPFAFRTKTGETVNLTGLHLTKDALIEHPEALSAVQKQLIALLRDGPLTLAYATPEPDATGVCQAQVTNSKGVWIQEKILQDGMAVLTSKPVTDVYLPSLLLVEQSARQQKIGLWQYKDLLVRTARSINLPEYNNTYQIVEGPIRYVRDLNRVIMVCLDDDPWQSVCLIVLRDLYKQMKDQDFDLMSPEVQNTVVRARGEVNYRQDAGLKMFIDRQELLQIVKSAAEPQKTTTGQYMARQESDSE
jgi:Staphylococcal nuclease homologue